MNSPIASRQILGAVLIAAAAIAPSPSGAFWVQDGVGVCTETLNQLNPQVASDGSGGVVLTWRDSRNGSLDIYAQRTDAAGAPVWALNGIAVCTAAGNQQRPQIVSDGAGGVIVAWRDSRNGFDDIYAQRLNSRGFPQWTTDGIAVCTAARHQWGPMLMSDGAGGAVITWYDDRATNWDIYAQRVDASGVPMWTVDGVEVSIPTGNQLYPQLVDDGDGGVIITWQDSRSGPADIYAQRLDSLGVRQWAVNGRPVCTSVDTQVLPRAVPDGNGGVIITWEDSRGGGSPDIYAQRMNDAGVRVWTLNGEVVCAASFSQSSPRIVSDGAGGAIITWDDYRTLTTTSKDIFAQRLDALGVPQWLTDGVAVCDTSGIQTDPEAVSDESGGVIVTWEDHRSGSYDVYAQRLDGFGASQWIDQGVATCAASNDQYLGGLLNDGNGGIVTTWFDYRGGVESDVYAQCLDLGSGLPTTVQGLSATVLKVRPNYPNPFSGGTTISLRPSVGGDVVLDVFDVTGRRVRHRVSQSSGTGWQSVFFDGRNEAGKRLPSGVYLYRLTLDRSTRTGKFVILH